MRPLVPSTRDRRRTSRFPSAVCPCMPGVS